MGSVGRKMAGRLHRRFAWTAPLLVVLSAWVSSGTLFSTATARNSESGLDSVPRDVAIGYYGEDPGEFQMRRLGNGSVLGITSFCVDDSGRIVVLDAAQRSLTIYDHEGLRVRNISLPAPWRALRVAASNGRLYALCRTGQGAGLLSSEGGGGARVPVVVAPEPEWTLGPMGAPHSMPVGDLHLVAYSLNRDFWEEHGLVIAAGSPASSNGMMGGVEKKGFLTKCGVEIYLYDPLTCASIRLTEDGRVADAAHSVVTREGGWRLPSGARAVKCGWGISLLWDDGSRRDMPWLAGSLIGCDLAGRLYVCEIDEEADLPKVNVAVYGGSPSSSVRWELPGRPGEVKMLGPRIVISEDGGLYEFWSTSSEFHITRWDIAKELAKASWDF